MSSSPTVGRLWQRRVVDQTGKIATRRVVIDGDAVHQVGNIARIGQTIGQRRLVDQELGAAIGQHIGDFRLLLAGAEQHRHQPRCAAANIASTNSMRLPSSSATRSPRCRPILRKPGRDLRRLLARPRASSSGAVAADQRFAVGISRGRIRDHRPDAFRPLAKCRHHAIAEARLKPHRRDGILRPVHQRSLLTSSTRPRERRSRRDGTQRPAPDRRRSRPPPRSGRCRGRRPESAAPPGSARCFSEIRSNTAHARNEPNRMIEPRSPLASRCAAAHNLTPASIGCFTAA